MNLHAARLNLGLNSREAAQKIGVSQDILLRAETGSRPQPRHAKAIADFYGCQVTDIWPIADPREERAA